MRLLTVSLFMFLNSCAYLAFGIPTFTTDSGVKIYNHTDIPIEEEAVQEYIETVLTHMGYTSNSADGIIIEFYDKLIQQGYMDDEHNSAVITDGIAYRQSGRVIVSIFTKCLGASSMGHELLHVLKGNYHGNAEFYDKVKKLDAELQANCSTEDLIIEADKRKTP